VAEVLDKDGRIDVLVNNAGLPLLYQKQMPHAAQPADAARVIYEAATSREPRLRWRVEENASANE
jgi:NAD(P)-dependent dehydrogenase (short-subunit alcohol dehydrogenase family)